MEQYQNGGLHLWGPGSATLDSEVNQKQPDASVVRRDKKDSRRTPPARLSGSVASSLP
ncbi:hypothetical protein HK102_005554, partial [Quaeritorhiza haematococci]